VPGIPHTHVINSKGVGSFPNFTMPAYHSGSRLSVIGDVKFARSTAFLRKT